MLQEFENVVEELFGKKPPLEKMYDAWMGEGNWETRPPQTRYEVTACTDVEWHNGEMIMAGKKFSCYICGRVDNWHIEMDEAEMKPRAIVCDGGPATPHDPTPTAFGFIRTVVTIPLHLVAKAEVVYQPEV